jgi:pyridoxal phosphate enzyme (YggS family)
MIVENILKIRQRINMACAKSGQDSARVCIVAVAKQRFAEQIRQVLACGLEDIGENRIQEALLKYDALKEEKIKWHMVGHLQTNKVKEAVKIFDLIHSVDSLRLAKEINKHAAGINKVQDILIEVKTSEEEAKFGLSPEDLFPAVEEIAKLENINIKGLMTIAPIVDDPEKSRPYFRKLRELKDKINHLRLITCDLQMLSMGMTEDFVQAIEEGANMVRLGRAIFEG